MPFRPFSKIGPLLFVLLMLASAGCAGTIKVEYSPKPADHEVRARAGTVVSVEPFEDARPRQGSSVRGSRTIGRVTSVVSNMAGTRVKLSEDVASMVERGFREELKGFGYTVAAKDEKAPLVLRGEVRDLSLDIGPRDVIALELAARIKDPATGEIVWSGTERLTDDRYAGVMGNTRGTISRYISANLSKVIRAMLSEATPMVAAYGSPPTTPAVATGLEAPAASVPVPEGSGRLVLATDPPRAKVYLDGVYFGLTPITIDTDPGIYDLKVSRKGFEDHEERVSLREGQTTEMEVSFGK
ncbi:MAG: PEGA domain-containing protein [Thermodesulfobacteriota bacterium]